jgi:hypothetical protein
MNKKRLSWKVVKNYQVSDEPYIEAEYKAFKIQLLINENKTFSFIIMDKNYDCLTKVTNHKNDLEDTENSIKLLIDKIIKAVNFYNKSIEKNDAAHCLKKLKDTIKEHEKQSAPVEKRYVGDRLDGYTYGR